MASNYVQRGDVVTVASPTGGVSSGDGVLIGGLFGVATATVAQTLDLELAVTGVWTLPSNSGDTFALGTKVYWDATAGECVDTATTDKEIGIALGAASAADTIEVLLIPTIRANISA